jgi:hypothetical protein
MAVYLRGKSGHYDFSTEESVTLKIPYQVTWNGQNNYLICV